MITQFSEISSPPPPLPESFEFFGKNKPAINTPERVVMGIPSQQYYWCLPAVLLVFRHVLMTMLIAALFVFHVKNRP